MSGINATSLLALRSQILAQNSALQKAAASGTTGIGGIGGGATPGVAGGTEGAQSADFTSALKDALGKVNDLQAKASDASEAYERGDTNDIAAVMLARQESSIGFQATLQVRNKLLSAYKDIMSMPV